MNRCMNTQVPETFSVFLCWLSAAFLLSWPLQFAEKKLVYGMTVDDLNIILQILKLHFILSPAVVTFNK